MKRVLKALCAAALAGCLILSTGCASLSLFSSTHYHGTQEIDKRLDTLERRMNDLEGGHSGEHTGSAAHQ